MLGRLRRTTRLDVGLVLAFAGIAYLVWALVAGVSRALVSEMIAYQTVSGGKLAGWIRVIFVEGGILLDLVGLAWMAVSLFLVMRSSRQRASVSWAWVSSICQVITATIGAVLVGWTAFKSHSTPTSPADATTMQQISGMSLPVVMVLAVLVWVTFLIWLLVERARLSRRGPTLSDGLRTNMYR